MILRTKMPPISNGSNAYGLTIASVRCRRHLRFNRK